MDQALWHDVPDTMRITCRVYPEGCAHHCYQTDNILPGARPVGWTGEEPTPSRGEEPTPSRGEEPTPSRGEEPTPSRGEEPTPSRGGEPTPSRGGVFYVLGDGVWRCVVCGASQHDAVGYPHLAAVDGCVVCHPCFLARLTGRPSAGMLRQTASLQEFGAPYWTLLQNPDGLPGLLDGVACDEAKGTKDALLAVYNEASEHLDGDILARIGASLVEAMGEIKENAEEYGRAVVEQHECDHSECLNLESCTGSVRRALFALVDVVS